MPPVSPKTSRNWLRRFGISLETPETPETLETLETPEILEILKILDTLEILKILKIFKVPGDPGDPGQHFFLGGVFLKPRGTPKNTVFQVPPGRKNMRFFVFRVYQI